MKVVLQENYKFIFEEALIDEIVAVSLLRNFKEGDVLIDSGD